MAHFECNNTAILVLRYHSIIINDYSKCIAAAAAGAAVGILVATIIIAVAK
jgi:hypothetical protein